MKPFIFFFNKGWCYGKDDRSGLSDLLLAFCQEFKKDENVELMVKINVSYAPNNWNLQNEIQKLNIDLKNAPVIRFIMDNVPYLTLINLYNEADVFVCPSRGEGFGLTMAEAMACGKSVITSSFGGQTDFITSDNGWLLPFKLVPCTDPNFIYEECQWGEIDIADLRKAMRNAYEDATGRQGKAKKALADISTFTWDNSAKKALEALKQL